MSAFGGGREGHPTGGREFLLAHRLFRSHRTGAIVKPAMTRFSFPPRWHYDVLRGPDYCRECGAERDGRLADAFELVEKRRQPDGRWLLQNRYSGKTFFELEDLGKPSPWNTLREPARASMAAKRVNQSESLLQIPAIRVQ